MHFHFGSNWKSQGILDISIKINGGPKLVQIEYSLDCLKYFLKYYKLKWGHIPKTNIETKDHEFQRLGMKMPKQLSTT
jgi:hypothetical protein